MKSLSMIIPAYNEASRLPRTFDLISLAIEQGVFSSHQLEEILVVDDGSRDETVTVTEAARTSHPALASLLRVIRVRPNQGKVNAIHTGIVNAAGTWCLIADADSATPWDQFKKLNQATEKAPIAIGSRDLPESDVRTRQSWIREHMGKTFNLLVRMITGLPFKDTQCGFKLIHRPSTLNFLTQLRVKRFAWDVEFLMFAKKYRLAIVEVPVAWEHQDDSHVHPIQDASEMLMRVIQLRFRLLFLKK
jgi:glycosyltransferase involved in cell wall biosynthesis